MHGAYDAPLSWSLNEPRMPPGEPGLPNPEQLYRLMVENTTDYAIILLDSRGYVCRWNPGAQLLLGYRSEEITGQHVRVLFTEEDQASGAPERELRTAEETGRATDNRWHVRQDGSRFWANGIATALRDERGQLHGFAKIMRDLTEVAAIQAESDSQRLEADRMKRLYETALSNTPDLVYVFDLDHRFSYANKVLLAMWGRTWEEAIGKNCLELGYEPWHAAMHDREIDQVLATRRPIKGVVPFTGTFGRRIYEYIFSPVFGENGEVEAIAGTTRDVTERHESEQRIQQSEKRFRSLMEQAPVSIQLLSPDGRTQRINRAFEELWGLRLEQLADYNVLRDPQLAAAGILPHLQRAFSGEPAHLPPVRYDAHASLPNQSRYSDATRWVSGVAYPLKDDAGRVREVVIIHLDITARKMVEQELYESEHRARTILESISDAFLTFDREWRYTYINHQAEKLLGKSAEALLGRTVWEEYPKLIGTPFETAYRQVAAQGVTCSITEYYADHDRWYELHVYPASDGISVYFRDVSERIRTEQALREADRRKDEFLATLAHELRNPLAPIRNALEVLKLPALGADVLKETRSMMERQVDQLVRLVDDLLDVSRVMQGKIELRKERIDLRVIASRSVEMVQPLMDAHQHRLLVTVSDAPLPVYADPIRLGQVLGNLLANAAKYTSPGGQIELVMHQAGSEAIIRVRDNGIGLAPEQLTRVFDLFVQVDHASNRAHGGLGIGLTLVRNLVAMHGGHVTAHSEGLGAGCEFVVRLPLAAPAQPEQTVSQPEQRAAPQRSRRLLIVDDNRDAATSLAMLLRMQGHEVYLAHSGPEALETLQAQRPEMVFLDLGMPHMDGYEVARRIRQSPELQSVTLAALTGWGQQEDRRRTAEAGFDYHLVKPLEPQLLATLLDDHSCGQSQSGQIQGDGRPQRD
jgi:PAS domain S-box-containing protein